MGTFFQIVGSIGLFLFGMKFMSDSLQKLAGEKLRAIMSSMTGNRFKGVFSGLLITTAIQSSTATTVMVVSFVNAGLLKLREAIGVIMGANLGTTVTAWIIAYFAFTFSLTSIALPIVGVGMIFFFMKKSYYKTFGEFLVGFGLLFMAMGYLKDSVPDINAHPEVLEFIRGYSNLGYHSILIFLAFGVVLTLVVQASAVAMAITMTMVMKGWIDFDLAAAIVLGENIGTTATALLAGVAGNTSAKRASLVHMIFNLIGVIWVLCVFPYFIHMVNSIVNGWFASSIAAAEAAGKTAGEIHSIGLTEKLALFHSMFNGLNILLLIGFVPLLERLVCRIVKTDPNERKETSQERLEYLASHFAEMGEICLFEGQKEVVKLAEMSTRMFNGFTDIFQKPDEDLSGQVNELRGLEEECDKLSYALTNFFIQCTSHELSEQSTNVVVKNMVIIAELEDMSDCCYRLITLARKRYRKQFKDQMLQSPAFVQFCGEIDNFLLFSHRMLLQQSVKPEDLENAIKIRTMLDKIRKSIRKEVIAEIELGAASARGGILFIEILGQCEKVGAHAMNILEALQNPSMLFAGPKIAKGQQPVLRG
ncbi:MAG: Na/Pi cotransporter family protein [Opitutales bacterium]|nr:Na/Pi cotransporter family protein [Opitutales bacterium]